jgi:hypothetical protein
MKTLTKFRITRAAFCLVPLCAAAIPAHAETITLTTPTGLPYSRSTLIPGITFDRSSLITNGRYSDIWSPTEASDGNVYFAWGDGQGFGGTNDGTDKLGVSYITGSPPGTLTYRNVWGGVNHSSSRATIPGKINSLVSIGGTLYGWVAQQDVFTNCTLWKSSDLGLTWTQSGPSPLLDETNGAFGDTTTCQFGQDYLGNTDGYVYLYDYRFFTSADSIIIARVPVGSLNTRSAYQFCTGVDGAGNASWSTNLSNAQPIFQDSNGVNWGIHCVYHPTLQRYLLSVRHGSDTSGLWGLFEGPHPWGPWKTIAYGTELPSWTYAPTPGDPHSNRPAYNHNFSLKWMSGNAVWHIFDRGDQFLLSRGTLQTSAPTPTPTATPSLTCSIQQKRLDRLQLRQQRLRRLARSNKKLNQRIRRLRRQLQLQACL